MMIKKKKIKARSICCIIYYTLFIQNKCIFQNVKKKKRMRLILLKASLQTQELFQFADKGSSIVETIRGSLSTVSTSFQVIYFSWKPLIFFLKTTVPSFSRSIFTVAWGDCIMLFICFVLHIFNHFYIRILMWIDCTFFHIIIVECCVDYYLFLIIHIY